MVEPIYLDYAAATPMDPRVLKVMLAYFSDIFYNPSAEYTSARKVRARINEARAQVAFWLGAKPDEIIFTAGGTEANNLAIRGAMSSYPDANVIISAVEHDSVRVPASEYYHKQLPVSTDGLVDPTGLYNMIDDKTVLVSVNYVNSEIGTIEPIRAIAEVIEKVKSERLNRGILLPLFFHTDAAQAAAYLDLHVKNLKVDLLTLNGGKIYGPKQSGALYVRKGMIISAQTSGGGQEANLRAGTENVPAIIGFAEALNLVQQCRKEESERLKALRNYFLDRLQSEIPGVSLNGSLNHRLCANLHVSFEGHDNETLLISLDQMGIQAAAGSACHAATEDDSEVLKAIGLKQADRDASLRFSLGSKTTKLSIDRAVEVLKLLVKPC